MTDTLERPASSEDREGWKAYWAAQDMPWRTEPEIDEQRQMYLAERRAVKPDIEKGIYPFRDENGGIKLTRADVEWLLATHDDGSGYVGPVDFDDGNQDERTGLDLRGADLRSVSLVALPLASVYAGLSRAEQYRLPIEQYLAERYSSEAGARLDGADLSATDLRGGFLNYASLQGAQLVYADLSEAELIRAQASQADFLGANLRDANLNYAELMQSGFLDTHLEGASLVCTNLAGARLTAVFFDAATSIEDPSLADKQDNYAFLSDIRWGDVNLANVDWEQLPKIGEECEARTDQELDGTPKHREDRDMEYIGAARAYRQLASALHSQGIREAADNYAYRAQLMQREVLRRQHHFLRWMGSAFLWLIAGYGYKPLRSLLTYFLVVLAFAVAYFLLRDNVHPALSPVDAVIFSITSFHGRGFSPGESVTLHNPLTIFAAFEAIIGLLIEITFIATFTQRFFAR